MILRINGAEMINELEEVYITPKCIHLAIRKGDKYGTLIMETINIKDISEEDLIVIKERRICQH